MIANIIYAHGAIKMGVNQTCGDARSPLLKMYVLGTRSDYHVVVYYYRVHQTALYFE